MQLTTVLIIATFLQVSANGFAQQLTLSKNNISIEQVFHEIEKQTGYNIIYSDRQLNDQNKLDVNFKNAALKDVLEYCLKNQSLVFAIEEKTIVIKKEEKTFFDNLITKFQAIDIKGRVRDEDGKPLAGANVSLLGSDKVTFTNAQGEFTLHTELEKATVVITCVGYQRQQFEVITGEFIVTMVREITGLDEIQVIGYGTSTKRLNTATVSSITSNEIKQQPVTNVLSALDGRMTGIKVNQANGMAGSAVSIKVRGDNTMGVQGSTNSDPLYVVDGIPQASGIRYDIQNYNSSVRGMNGYTNIFSILNKEDIERVDALKDADATAIYGARGANGVVLITTKKGKEGKVKLNVNLTSGAGKVGHFIPMLNIPQYLDLRKEAFKNENITPDASNAPDLVSWDQNAYTDFQRLLLGGSAKIQTADVSASGGSEYVNYYVGLNYRKEGTVVADDQYVNRAGGLMNLNITSPNKRFNALFSVNYAIENSNLNVQNFMDLIYLPPNFSLYKADGSLNWNNSFSNPMAYLLTSYHAQKTFFSGNATLSYILLKGLTLKTTAGYTVSGINNDSELPSASFNPVSATPSRATFAESPTSNYIIEPQAEYIVNAGPGKLTALVGNTFSQALSETTILYGSNYAYDNQLNTITGAGIVNTSYYYDQYRYASVFGRLSYDIQNKYLINTTFRRDASSRFGPDNRFANFASVGAAWLFSEEKLIKEKLSFLSFGKLKMSYGTTGNDRIDNYLYLMNYYGYNVYQDIRSLTPIDQAANPAIKWESTKKAEINLSLGFFKDRILFNGSLYRNHSSNLLNFTSLASQSGVSTAVENLDALVQNQGLELELNAKNIVSKGFSWNSSFNISFESNKLLSFNDIEKSYSAGNYYIGEAIDAFLNRRKYQYAGINPATGVPTYADVDGGLNQYIAPLGHPFYGGLNNSFSYKGFSLDFFFKFQNSRGGINQLSYHNSVAPGGLWNQTTSVLDRWHQSGDAGALWPAAVTGRGALSSASAYLGSSDFTYGNTSYIKLKTADLNYQLPKTWANKVKMQQITVGLQGLNLFTLAKDKYVLDPEYGYSAYPGLRTLLLTINCSL